MHNYCTLFNAKYLSRGLALYDSLLGVNASFRLFVLAMDDATATTLRNLKLRCMTVITLNEFEDAELKQVKLSRTFQEYCWTCTPSIIRFCMQTFELPECTYLDADIFFFAKPEILQREFKGKSILITEHRYHPDYDYSSTSGRFCVQYVSFRNDRYGNEALEWWRRACNEWCHAYYEDGKFGDQMYLNDWPERFKNLRILKHAGGGLAPWNLSTFDVSEVRGKVHIFEKATGKATPLVFYHFHDFRFDAEGNWFHSGGFPGYHIGRDAYRSIYATYLKSLFSQQKSNINTSLTDMPSLPQSLSEMQFDRMIIPKVRKQEDRLFLRKAYKRRDTRYSLSADSNFTKQEKIFSILVDAGYNLDRYVFWPFPGNYVYEFMKENDARLSKFKKLFAGLKAHRAFRLLSIYRRKLVKNG